MYIYTGEENKSSRPFVCLGCLFGCLQTPADFQLGYIREKDEGCYEETSIQRLNESYTRNSFVSSLFTRENEVFDFSKIHPLGCV